MYSLNFTLQAHFIPVANHRYTIFNSQFFHFYETMSLWVKLWSNCGIAALVTGGLFTLYGNAVLDHFLKLKRDVTSQKVQEQVEALRVPTHQNAPKSHPPTQKPYQSFSPDPRP